MVGWCLVNVVRSVPGLDRWSNRKEGRLWRRGGYELSIDESFTDDGKCGEFQIT
jgi:hypothetical protein